MRLAALAWKIERTPSVAAFADRLDRTLAEVAARGAELVLLPEYAPVEVGAARAAGRGARAEVAEAAALAPALEDAMAALAARHGVWLLGGSLPAEEDGRLVNRATLFAPDRRRAVQRKCTMTRFEAEEWGSRRAARRRSSRRPGGGSVWPSATTPSSRRSCAP